MKHRGLTLTARLLSGVAAIALASAAGAAAAEDLALNIRPQPLGDALNEFAVQARYDVVFAPGLVAEKTTRGVTTAPDAETALTQMLEGSGLSFRRSGGAFLIVQGGSGPQGSSAGGDVDALIVTAQKREENIQDVPIAISAFSQEDLTRSQVAGGPDLMTQVPNMTFTKTNFSSYSIQIRGIGTQAISATTDPAVAVAFNNTPFIRNHFFEQEFYDLQRVEVLRGPQGTLYGRNATAGVVNVISAKPKFTYEAKVAADVANYNSTRLEGMINLPLVEDKVALRLAGAWTKRDGFVTNEISGNPIDGRDLWSTRLSLRFAPTDAIDANLIWEHFEEDDDRLRSGKQLCHQDDRDMIDGHVVPPINGYSSLFSQGCLPASLYSPDSFEAPNGLSLPYYLPLGAIFLPVKPGFNPYASLTQSRDLRVIESTVDPHYRAKSDLFELQLSFDLSDSLTLTSETGYNSDFLFSTQDFNRFNTASGAFQDTIHGDREGVLEPGPLGGIFCDPQIGCADRVVAVDLSTSKSRQFSQEFRLASDYDGPFNFSLGANFTRHDAIDKYYVFINTLSLYAATAPYTGDQLYGLTGMPDWVAGVSDNRECMRNGLRPPDPSTIYSVIGCTYVDPNPIDSLNDLGHNYFLSKNPYKLISYAVFGEAYYNIADNLKVTAGLRWTVDKKEAPRIPSWVLGAATAGYPVAEIVEQEWREPTGRLAIDWKPDLSFTDETMIYASYARGYKAGGANPPPPGVVTYNEGEFGLEALAELVAKPKTFSPEFINAFELGSKNTFFDGKVTLNLAAFYYDYTDYQISQIIDRSAVNYNFDAQIWGLELEADWRPLENLRLGLKLGYESTEVADGEKAIDIMDRVAGHHEGSDDVWVVVRPFPTQSSNCVLPLYVVTRIDGSLGVEPNTYVNGNPGPCETAYLFNQDPVTRTDYSDPPVGIPFNFPSDYPGFNPLDESQGHNHGEGFFTDLSGNELPNAPHFTATITADWTLPLPNDWLATFHTDLYYQSEAWTRIFNMEGYDKLKAYSNINVAAIFANEDAGWRVMAYVKNVLDRDSITGAFLNSDDTGLTTNVFLTEPRLYGVRVTKEFTGGPWWTGAGPDHVGPYPLTVEIGGQVQRFDAPYASTTPSFSSEFSDDLNTLPAVEGRDLDWGDAREVRLTYRPGEGPWMMSAGIRYGKANGASGNLHTEEPANEACGFGGIYVAYCPIYAAILGHDVVYMTATNWSDASATNREEHKIADFTVGRDVGIGIGASKIGLGLRYAQLKSETSVSFTGETHWYLDDGWVFPRGSDNSHFDKYQTTLAAEREFKGAGPVLSWDAAIPLLGGEDGGEVTLDWSIGGGALFGKQKTNVEGVEAYGPWNGPYSGSAISVPVRQPDPDDIVTTPVNIRRTKSVTVPVVDLSLGLSYEIQRVKIGAGYRWERYFDVLDAGFTAAEDADRTIDGPYFKLAIGFGG